MSDPKAQTASPRRSMIRVYIPLVLFALSLGWWLYSQINWVEYEVDLGMTDKARNNPFLAATLFLQEHGVTVSTERSFRLFDQPLNYPESGIGDTIVLVDAYGSLSAARMQNLLLWVEQGGHLIATASNAFTDNIDSLTDPLFEHFGIFVDRQNGEGMEQEVWELVNRYGYLAGLTGAELCPMLTAQTRFSFSGDDTEIGVHFLNTDRLQADSWQPDAWVGEAASAYMLHYDVGEGLVTLVTSLNLWKNSAVGCLDHAWFLWQIAPEDGMVTLFSSYELPGVVDIIWRYFDLALVSAVLMLLLWLWYRGVRFGPVRENFAMERRQLLEHIEASAHFLWRIRKTDQLMASIRQQTLQQLKDKHPQIFAAQPDSSAGGQLARQSKLLSKKPDTEQFALAAKLAVLLSLPTGQIQLALWQPIDNDPQRMTDTLAAIQKIKEKI